MRHIYKKEVIEKNTQTERSKEGETKNA